MNNPRRCVWVVFYSYGTDAHVVAVHPSEDAARTAASGNHGYHVDGPFIADVAGAEIEEAAREVVQNYRKPGHDLDADDPVVRLAYLLGENL